MAGNIYSLYPQYNLSSDRRKQEAAMPADRRCGEDRRSSERPAVDPKLTKDLHEVKDVFSSFTSKYDKSQQNTENVETSKKKYAEETVIGGTISLIPGIRRLSSIAEPFLSGDYIKAAGKGAILVSNLDEDYTDIVIMGKCLRQKFKHLLGKGKVKGVKKNTFNLSANYPASSLSKNSGYIDEMFNPSRITKQHKFSFLKGTPLRKLFSKYQRLEDFVNKIDKTLIDLPLIKSAIEKLDKSAVINDVDHSRYVISMMAKKSGRIKNPKVIQLSRFSVVNCGAVEVKGKFLTKVIARSCARIPVMSVLVALGLGIPSVIKGIKNGEGTEAAAKGFISIAGFTVGGAVLGAVLAPLLGAVGSIAGVGLGTWLGNKAAEKINQTVFKDKNSTLPTN